jgi:hypothetical protein
MTQATSTETSYKAGDPYSEPDVVVVDEEATLPTPPPVVQAQNVTAVIGGKNIYM